MIPILDLHRSSVVELLVHLESLPQKMRLVTPTFLQTLIFSSLKIVHQNGLIVRVRSFVNNHPSSLSRRETTNVGKTLLCDDDIQIMLGLIDMGTHRDNA